MTHAEQKAVDYQINTIGPNALGGLLSEDEYKMFNLNHHYLHGYLDALEEVKNLMVYNVVKDKQAVLSIIDYLTK